MTNKIIDYRYCFTFLDIVMSDMFKYSYQKENQRDPSAVRDSQRLFLGSVRAISGMFQESYNNLGGNSTKL